MLDVRTLIRKARRQLTPLVEILICVQAGIAEKFKQTPVKVLRATLQNSIDISPAIPSLRGVVETGLNLEFLHDIGAGERRVSQFGNVVVGRTDPFNQIIIVVLALTIDLNANITAAELGRGIQFALRAGGKGKQLLKILRSQRQVADIASFDGLAGGRGSGVDVLHLRLHFDLFLHRRRTQVNRHARGFSDAHGDIRKFAFPESGTGDTHRIRTDRQQSRRERAIRVRLQSAAQRSSVLVENADVSSGEDCATGILHCASDRPRRPALAQSMPDQRQYQTNPDPSAYERWHTLLPISILIFQKIRHLRALLRELPKGRPIEADATPPLQRKANNWLARINWSGHSISTIA